MKKPIVILLLVSLIAAFSLAAASAEGIDSYPLLATNFNVYGVKNLPEYYPDFRTDKAAFLVQAITTYHWNGGRGAAPGSISLYDWDDNLIGSWQATSRGGSGAKNVYWDVFPNIVLEQGKKYYIIDSDPSTWSANDQSGGAGFFEIRGIEADSAAGLLTPSLVKVSFTSDTVVKGEKATIKAVTNTAVDTLCMYAENGSLVKTWSSGYTDKGDVRTWKVKYSFKSAGNRALTFMGRSGEAESDPIIARVTVQEQRQNKEVRQAKEHGLIPDCLQDADLTQPITAAEFSALAVRLFEEIWQTQEIPEKTPFTNIAGHPLKSEIEKAWGLGFLNPIKADSFNPDAGFSRALLARMYCNVIRACEYDGFTRENIDRYSLPYTATGRFADEAEISEAARDSVYYLASNGLMDGAAENRFDPAGAATREQAIIVAERIFAMETEDF